MSLGQVAKGHLFANLLPSVEDGLGLFEHIGWISFCWHNYIPPIG